MRLAYLYSRYPVLSQTFCDTEMLELERRGFPLLIGSIHSPLTSIRHGHAARLKAPIIYAPPAGVLRVWEEIAKRNGQWPTKLIEAHDRKYGATFKAGTRARNALFFADLFARRGIDRFHVHFANRAAHTAIFLKAISGIPFSVTAHGQDFMADLGSDELLREICAEAEFVAVETDYSRGLLAAKCPGSAGKIHRVFNGMDLATFAPPAVIERNDGALRIVSVGRLVPFKGFDYLIAACADLRARSVAFTLEIIGDGPLRERLQAQIEELGLGAMVKLSGALSQETVREHLVACNVFALAAIVDDEGTSDVFPTVILEAMASAKPVVSTRLAGIPEAVIDGETGRLVPPRDSAAVADALEEFSRHPELRERFGRAGRNRIERELQISETVRPLLHLLEAVHPKLPPVAAAKPAPAIAYLVHRWPDAHLPGLEAELRALRSDGVSVTVFVCEYDPALRLTEARKELLKDFVFLPDEMVIEAAWQTDRSSAHRLEENRANRRRRPSAAASLRAARHAVSLLALLRDRDIRHLHATSARALLCASYLRVLGSPISLSATVSSDKKISREVMADLLQECVGGRVSADYPERLTSPSFLLAPSRAGIAGWTQLGFSESKSTGRQWAELLKTWSKAGRASL